MKKGPLHIVLLTAFFALTRCAGTTNYEVLSFFFDGVPSPDTSANFDSKEIQTGITPQQNDLLSAISEKTDTLIIHRPYAEKKCKVCHDVTAMSEAKKQILQRCNNCHSKFQQQYKYVHGPVAVLDCVSCHAPHKSENAGLLKRTGDTLCTYCHTNLGQVEIDQHAKIGSVGCLECHKPHFSNDNKFFVITGKSES